MFTFNPVYGFDCSTYKFTVNEELFLVRKQDVVVLEWNLKKSALALRQVNEILFLGTIKGKLANSKSYSLTKVFLEIYSGTSTVLLVKDKIEGRSLDEFYLKNITIQIKEMHGSWSLTHS